MHNCNLLVHGVLLSEMYLTAMVRYTSTAAARYISLERRGTCLPQQRRRRLLLQRGTSRCSGEVHARHSIKVHACCCSEVCARCCSEVHPTAVARYTSVVTAMYTTDTSRSLRPRLTARAAPSLMPHCPRRTVRATPSGATPAASRCRAGQ